MIQCSNNFINNQLKRFIDEKEVEYALLLSGEWGVGKTWLINNFKKTTLDQDEKNVFYYISLNGLSLTKEIDDKIFSLLYPILGSDQVKFGKELLEKTIKATLKVDLDFKALNSSEFEVTIPQIKLPESMVSKKNAIFCFDDLERCKVDIKELLGYINHIVEHEKAKVIIIADEDKIEEKKSYEIMKEKVIGHTIYLKKDVGEVVPALISNFNARTKKIITENMGVIKLVVEDLNFYNYRALKQVLLNFSYLLSYIDEIYLDKKEHISQILKYFIFLNLSIKKGEIKEIYINDLGSYYYSSAEELIGKQKVISDYKKKYASYFGNFQVFNWETWGEIILNDKDYSHKINSELSFQFKKNEIADWLKFLLYRDKTHAEIVFLANKLKSEIINAKLNEVGEILHIISLYIYFVDEKILYLDLETIKTFSLILIQNIVRNVVDKEKMQEYIMLSRGELDVWGGYSFYSNRDPKFQKYYADVCDIMNVELKKKYLIDIKKSLLLMESNTYEFCNVFFNTNLNGCLIYIYSPVEEFFNFLIECSPRNQVSILRYIFNNRSFNQGEYLVFEKWIKGLKESLINYNSNDKIFHLHRDFLIKILENEE